MTRYIRPTVIRNGDMIEGRVYVNGRDCGRIMRNQRGHWMALPIGRTPIKGHAPTPQGAAKKLADLGVFS